MGTRLKNFQMSKIEEDISREWQIKCDRMMSAVTEKHNRQIEDLKSEKEELLRKVDELEKKVSFFLFNG